MANTKTTTKKTTTKKATPAKAKPESVTEEKPVSKVDTSEVNGKEADTHVIPKDIDLNEYITVKNGFQGKLIYESKKTKEVFVWGAFGDEQELTLRELKEVKNSCKAMFQNNWFMFDEEFQWVLGYLGVSNFYHDIINLNEFDEVLTSPASELKERIKNLSEGQKTSLSYRAKQLVLDGVIDSRKAIKVLEDVLSIELIEK